MSRKDDLQFLTTDLEYSDETPQAAAPLFPDEADDTLVGKLGLFKGSRHPGVALFHVLFKSLALAVYLFAGLFTSNSSLICLSALLNSLLSVAARIIELKAFKIWGMILPSMGLSGLSK